MDNISDRLSGLDYSEQCTAEARRLFKKCLLTELNKRLKIKSKATFIGDGLVVQLIDTDGKEAYRHVLHNVNRIIYFGTTSETVAQTIVSEFRKNVLKKYFKHSYCRVTR